MDDIQLIILVISIAIIIGIILFVLSGLFHVKKDEVSVFEKLYTFHSIKEEGYYFFTPLVTKRVGNYSLKPQYIRINLSNFNIILKR